MISEVEFKENARMFNVPISSIERDYAQSWLLAHLPTMAFKGGTGIRKAYINNYRFSDDLDFTLLDIIDINDLQIKIKKAITETRDESGISFRDDFKSETVENGYVFTVYFRILRTSGDPLKIKIDLTKKENEKIINPLQKRDILHVYSDKLDKQIMVYTLEEIFVEKVRSLFERTRPRDLYDVWYLNKNVTFDKTLFEKKCKFKKVEPNIDELITKQSKYENAWEPSLRHQLPDLPSAAAVFDNVVEFLKPIL
jgi:predicted nucleotidyltransferase component of viral defense system